MTTTVTLVAEASTLFTPLRDDTAEVNLDSQPPQSIPVTLNSNLSVLENIPMIFGKVTRLLNTMVDSVDAFGLY